MHCVSILRPIQYGRHFPYDILKLIFVNDNLWILIKISLKFAPIRSSTIYRAGDKPLFEPMMVSLLMHLCVTRPQWGKEDKKLTQNDRFCLLVVFIGYKALQTAYFYKTDNIFTRYRVKTSRYVIDIHVWNSLVDLKPSHFTSCNYFICRNVFLYANHSVLLIPYFSSNAQPTFTRSMRIFIAVIKVMHS